METVTVLMRFLEKYQFPISTSLSVCDKAMEETLAILIKSNVVRTLEDTEGSEVFYYADDEKRGNLNTTRTTSSTVSCPMHLWPSPS